MQKTSFAACFLNIESNNHAFKKLLASSLTRSLFTGGIVAFSSSLNAPLFKIGRANVTEKVILYNDLGILGGLLYRIFIRDGDDYKGSGEWLIVANTPGVVVRNIDHLIPIDAESSNSTSDIDFYWMPSSYNGRDISSHFWAVRAKHLPMLLERWESMWSSKDEHHYNESQMWSEMIKSLPLKKKPFEKGEIYCPEVGAVDWDAITKAAIVMVPNWPEKMQWSFLQSLYFGTYFGDETGLMLNLLDA